MFCDSACGDEVQSRHCNACAPACSDALHAPATRRAKRSAAIALHQEAELPRSLPALSSKRARAAVTPHVPPPNSSLQRSSAAAPRNTTSSPFATPPPHGAANSGKQASNNSPPAAAPLRDALAWARAYAGYAWRERANTQLLQFLYDFQAQLPFDPRRPDELSSVQRASDAMCAGVLLNAAPEGGASCAGAALPCEAAAAAYERGRLPDGGWDGNALLNQDTARRLLVQAKAGAILRAHCGLLAIAAHLLSMPAFAHSSRLLANTCMSMLLLIRVAVQSQSCMR